MTSFHAEVLQPDDCIVSSLLPGAYAAASARS